LRIEDVLALANRQVPTQLQDDAAYRQRIAKGAQFLDSLLDKEGVIYGVTTGYGDSCVVAVPLHHVEACRVICTPSTVAAWANCSTPRPPAPCWRRACSRCATACPGCAWNCWSACTPSSNTTSCR
jgi:hypothetical protein